MIVHAEQEVCGGALHVLGVLLGPDGEAVARLHHSDYCGCAAAGILCGGVTGESGQAVFGKGVRQRSAKYSRKSRYALQATGYKI